ncbi:MAG: protein-tyrosine phosphatase family protein [Xanthobacteraceae bacterium]
MIHVCSLARLQETVDETGARHVVSLLGDEASIERPNGIVPENHLWLRLHDIAAPLDGYIVPAEQHVAGLLDFVRGWNRRAPLVVHCFAGISRSTASAFAAVCALNPLRTEASIAQALRHASPTATPNIRIVSLADRLLGRDGRMIAAVETIGRGVLAAEATPFRLDLE